MAELSQKLNLLFSLSVATKMNPGTQEELHRWLNIQLGVKCYVSSGVVP